jgi:hypothetical protein
MPIKLTKSQAESFELLHASISNGLTYAEDLFKSKHIAFRETMPPVMTKLRWLKTAIELKIPEDRRGIAQTRDQLFFDEMLRLMTHMSEEQRGALENFIKTTLKVK